MQLISLLKQANFTALMEHRLALFNVPRRAELFALCPSHHKLYEDDQIWRQSKNTGREKCLLAFFAQTSPHARHVANILYISKHRTQIPGYGLEMGTNRKMPVHFMEHCLNTNIHKLCNEINH